MSYTICNMESVQFATKRIGVGRPMSQLVATCLSLQVNQGVRITPTKYDGGKGITCVYNAGKKHNIRFRVRRDRQGNRWVMRMRLNGVDRKVA